MFFDAKDIIELTHYDGGTLRLKTLEESYQYCESIAKRHYENFPVGSILIPKSVRKYFYSIYAYSRLTDDIADEFARCVENKEKGVEMLAFLAESANSKYKDFQGNPILWALSDTIVQLNLPSKPFQDLTIAFINDINFKQSNDMNELLDYCKYSANPVGELVLRLFNEYDEEKKEHSDCVCTALQLVNFWQDLSVDIPNGRIYIPKSLQKKHNILEIDLQKTKNFSKLHKCIEELYELTFDFFIQGERLVELVESKRLKWELKLIIGGGKKILSKVVRLKENIFVERPTLAKYDILSIFLKSLFFKG